MMFVANFLTPKEKTNYNVKVSFFDYVHYLINRKTFLQDLSLKYGIDFNTYYFKGVKLWIDM